MAFLLTVDKACDERSTVLDELKIPWIPMTFTMDGREVVPDTFATDAEYQNFYQQMEAGAMPTTSQTSVEQHQAFFEQVIKQYQPTEILHLSLAGGISNNIFNAQKAAENLKAPYPGVQIYCLDTILATQAMNVLVYEAVKLRDAGLDAQTAYQKLAELRMHVQPWFMVDDLQHLKRGGRISTVAAAFGSMLRLKPILKIDTDGTLKVVNKVMGVRKALDFFVDLIAKESDQLPAEVFLIHAHAPANLALLQQKINQKYPQIKVRTGWLGPIIGAHCGSGMIGLGFIGKHR